MAQAYCLLFHRQPKLTSRESEEFINYLLFMVLEPGRDLRERPVLGYKRPLTI